MYACLLQLQAPLSADKERGLVPDSCQLLGLIDPETLVDLTKGRINKHTYKDMRVPRWELQQLELLECDRDGGGSSVGTRAWEDSDLIVPVDWGAISYNVEHKAGFAEAIDLVPGQYQYSVPWADSIMCPTSGNLYIHYLMSLARRLNTPYQEALAGIFCNEPFGCIDLRTVELEFSDCEPSGQQASASASAPSSRNGTLPKGAALFDPGAVKGQRRVEVKNRGPAETGGYSDEPFPSEGHCVDLLRTSLVSKDLDQAVAFYEAIESCEAFQVVGVKNDFKSEESGKMHYRSLTIIVMFSHDDPDLGPLSMLCEMQILPRTAWDISHDTHRWYIFSRQQDGSGDDASDVFTEGWTPGYLAMELRCPDKEPGSGPNFKSENEPRGMFDCEDY